MNNLLYHMDPDLEDKFKADPVGNTPYGTDSFVCHIKRQEIGTRWNCISANQPLNLVSFITEELLHDKMAPGLQFLLPVADQRAVYK